MKTQAEEQEQIMNKLSADKEIELENAKLNKDIQRDVEIRRMKEKLEDVKVSGDAHYIRACLHKFTQYDPLQPY